MRRILLVLLAVGCAKKRDPAPTDMVDLVRYLFLHWEDADALPEAVDNLGAWLDRNIDTDAATDGLELEPLSEADLAGIEHPDADLSLLIGAAGEAHSAFPIEDHAGYVVLPDQTFSNPAQYKFYERTITEGDALRFPSGDDPLLRTTNDIETSTLGVTIPYDLNKDYRWVTGVTETAVVARSWTEQEFCNDGGGNCLEQTYSIDLFYADGPDASQRMTATWSEVDASFDLPHDALVATLANGIQNVFRSSEEFLEGDGT